MNKKQLENYNQIRNGGTGFYPQKRGLLGVYGAEAVKFLNGMITNDVTKLEDGAQMLAAFPNAQGRLQAIVRVMRKGEMFLFETEEATLADIEHNLMRWTFAGDFHVDNEIQYDYESFTVWGEVPNLEGNIQFGKEVFVREQLVEDFKSKLNNAVQISDEVYNVLRIEGGIPLYGVDMDETTIVPELGLDGLISYNKGCYIGQEIIARIYFRGHVAKQLRGLVLSGELGAENRELKSLDDKNAGKITSVCYSPKLEKYIALGFVRYDYLAEGTELKIGEITATVKDLPFVEK
ncbi:MAG TPA: glycine cleavage T C-terminal barrel domain-containing protein [Pyrinomonadaceae bacterium]|nr:glycine cleavage T C-terminal barrel domain-containing protein [Pyrinomonadaceae bacterium]